VLEQMSQIEKHLVEIDTNLKYQESETFLKTSYKDIDQFNSLFISKVICVDFFFPKGTKTKDVKFYQFSHSFHFLVCYFDFVYQLCVSDHVSFWFIKVYVLVKKNLVKCYVKFWITTSVYQCVIRYQVPIAFTTFCYINIILFNMR
jgi:hypothetical protein